MARSNPAFRGIYAYDETEAPDGETVKSSPAFRGIYTYDDARKPDGDPDTAPIPPGPMPENDTAPVIESTATTTSGVGSLDTAGVWTPAGGSYTYQWQVNGVDETGETDEMEFAFTGLEADDVVTIVETYTLNGVVVSEVSNSITITAE